MDTEFDPNRIDIETTLLMADDERFVQGIELRAFSYHHQKIMYLVIEKFPPFKTWDYLLNSSYGETITGGDSHYFIEDLKLDYTYEIINVEYDKFKPIWVELERLMPEAILNAIEEESQNITF